MLVAIAILAVLLVINALLATAELAVMTSRHSRLAADARRGDRGAAKALQLARTPTRFLSTVQFGITIIGIFAGAYGENSLARPLRQWLAGFPAIAPYAATLSLIVVVLAITYVSLVFGELIPKRLALAYPEALARFIARPLDLVSRVVAVPVHILSLSTDGLLALFRVRPPDSLEVSEEDVRSLMARAATTGVFEPREHDLLQRVFRVRDLRARDLMVPRADVLFIERSWTVQEVRVLVGTSPYSHYPVCNESLDDVVGIVHIKDLISYGLLESAEFTITDVARKPLYVPEATPALKLLEAFQAQRTHVALVVDEYGAVEGLISINDVLRTLVGDISRLGQEEPPRMVRRDDGSFLADGSLPLHEFVQALSIPPEATVELRNVSTVAGLMLAVLNRLPDRGDWVTWQGLRLEVVDMDRQRVDQVLVQRVTPAPKDEDAGGPR